MSTASPVRRVAYRLALIALFAIVLWLPSPAAAQAVKGEVKAVVENGFARLVIHLAEEVEAQPRLANNIITISFQRPVDVAVDRLTLPGYISAARRDPDGKAIRLAVARKVTMNSMAAAERLFVDLLPEEWTGLPPGLPRDVIEDLARRARDAERRARQQQTLARQKVMAPTRVRVVAQPTFTRYVFELPELTAVAADNTKDKLTLTFDTTLKFDLADARAALPAAIEAIDSLLDQDSVIVRFSFAAKVDVRTFREDNSYVVDVTPMGGKAAKIDGSVRSDELGALAVEMAARENSGQKVEAPQTTPAQQADAVPTSPAVPAAPAVAPLRATPAAPVRGNATAPASAPPQTPAPVQPQQQSQGPAPAQTQREPDPRPQFQVQPQPQPPPQPQAHDEVRVAAPSGAVRLGVKRNGESVAMTFAFPAPTPAAIFRRADSLWLVFDSDAPISLAPLEPENGRSIKNASLSRLRDVALLRIRLERPMLVSATADGSTWTVTLGPEVVDPTRPLAISRNIVGASRSSIAIPLDDPRDLHRLEDADAGDSLLVATALGPARGFLKTQDFVEFRVLASTHGVVIQPLSDDLNAELAADKVIVTRPTGLSLSPGASEGGPTRGAGYQRQVLDMQSWGFDRQADFAVRRSELTTAAAAAPEAKRFFARADLARFYLARDMAYEAKGVLDVALAEAPPTADNSTGAVLHAVCNIMMGRPELGLKDLANPFVGNQHDAPLWRAMAYAKLGKWADARETFRSTEAAIGTLPLELQRSLLLEMLRSAIEVGDITGATGMLHEFETVGVPRELEPAVSVLTGRLYEGLGRPEDARRAYKAAADSWDRPAVAQGRLREIVLRQSLGEVQRSDAIVELETLAATWRGDATEIEALQMLARLYTEDGRYRDAFQIMRTAMAAHPNSDMTRRIQDEAAATFASLFLGGRADALPAIEALALFYDYRELTPIGRRGDEMIRRLADRLVSLDLLYQASELLQHQVDHRLQGAARAQVASRLAVIYLMDRKPDRALATLRVTRVAELNNELRNQRLLLEARALSETGRHDLAIEVIENVSGREVVRLRSDIYWAAKRWNEAAEQIELLYGDRWQEFEPLSETERLDILRGGIGYSLAEDSIGLMRFRDKYAAKMGDGPDRRAFDVITAPSGGVGSEFQEVARQVASADTLEGFLRDLRARFPETGALPAVQPPAREPGAAGANPPGATGRTAAAQ